MAARRTRRRSRDEYENPHAPPAERRLRADHPDVIDSSYTRSRTRQLLDLFKGSLFDPGFVELENPHDETTWPTERLEIYIKERRRGPGYVSDFVYHSRKLPVVTYGIFIDRGCGIEIAELELFRRSWAFDHDDRDAASVSFDEDLPGDGDHIPGELTDDADTDDGDAEIDDGPGTLITADLLRRIPLGRIVAQAQERLARTDWQEEGITVYFGPDRGPDELTGAERDALDTAVAAAGSTRRGRPELPDDLLEKVARAYLEEATTGVGLTRRLAQRFNRPEATVRDWIAAARRRDFLSPAVPGRRAAAAGSRLSTRR